MSLKRGSGAVLHRSPGGRESRMSSFGFGFGFGRNLKKVWFRSTSVQVTLRFTKPSPWYRGIFSTTGIWRSVVDSVYRLEGCRSDRSAIASS